ncbi:hypothetical protein RvY_17874 [Ramazzottius varieornatus]|uniref:Uncharacterized protein n=1 Tax=Ramazzottius varieornatus TaxID=947166 RepID=A0A1D1W4C6_RAMVA|nr:hypothetical protein RvY_17874 [Ramazzottius varieornatus]
MEVAGDPMDYLKEFSRRGEVYGRNGAPTEVITNAYQVKGRSGIESLSPWFGED